MFYHEAHNGWIDAVAPHKNMLKENETTSKESTSVQLASDELLYRVDEELKKVNFQLRNTNKSDLRHERWLGYSDALKWVKDQIEAI